MKANRPRRHRAGEVAATLRHDPVAGYRIPASPPAGHGEYAMFEHPLTSGRPGPVIALGAWARGEGNEVRVCQLISRAVCRISG
jgi:hypothetical protein